MVAYTFGQSSSRKRWRSSFISALRAPEAHEHPQAAPLLHQLFVDELLVALEHGERIQAEVRSDAADRGQRVSFLEHSFEDHRYHPVSQLPVDRQAVVPLRIHGRLHGACGGVLAD